MTRVVAHVDRLVLKGLRVADPSSFGSAMQGELKNALAVLAPAGIAHQRAQVLRTTPVRFDRALGDARVARDVAREIAKVLRS